MLLLNMNFGQPNFGEMLSSLRHRKGIKQSDLAKIMNVSNTTISSWETNNSEPSLAQLRTLSEFFNVPVGVLLETEEFRFTDKRSKY